MRKKRTKLKNISVMIDTSTHGVLSELCWALDKSVSEIIREMIHNDLPRFKDRHRKAISDGKKSDDFDEGSHSADL